MPSDSSSSGPRMPVGLIVAGSEMASFTILGLLLDYGLGTMPGFTIGLTLLGLVLAFYHLVKLSRAMSQQRPNPPANNGAP